MRPEIPIIQLEASNDRAACNMDYYPMDAALGTHEVFSNWNYDQLFKDFLHKTGIIINCETLTVEWQGKSIPMNSKSFQGASSGMCRLRVNYTLPINSDIVRKRQGCKYMTTLDLNMMFTQSN